MEVPETRYAKTGDGLKLAYQVFGSGPNVLLVPPILSNVELSWENELWRRAYEYWGRHVRIAQFDKRGIGGSDRTDVAPTLEQRIEDIRTVMDVAGMDHASLAGLSEGGLMSQLFSVRYPERVDRLVLLDSTVGVSYWDAVDVYVAPGERIVPLEEVLGKVQVLIDSWGDDPKYLIDWFMPSQSDNAPFVRWAGRLERQTASPADVARQFESITTLDGVDPADIKVPTLVIQVLGDRVVEAANGRFLADRIPDAELCEVQGDDHFLWVLPSWREISDRCIEFIIGHPVPSGSNRQFATILFTDLVDSTATSSAAGDRAWSNTLDSHGRISQAVISDERGRLIKSTGDGVLATFEAPSEAVRAASRLVSELKGIGLTIRAGIHTGEVDLRDDGDVSGTAVNFAARVEGHADPGSVFVSSVVRDLLLGSDFSFEDRGEFELKGLSGGWHLYSLKA